MYMDAFGWSAQSPATAAADDDDVLLAAVLGASFELHSIVDGGGLDADLPPQSQQLTLPSDDSPPPAFLGSVNVLPAIAGADAHDGGLLDRITFPNVPEMNTAFSGYSTTTAGGISGGGGNMSSGESNTYGGSGGCGHDTEVASSSAPCAAVPTTTLAHPSKRKLPETTTTSELTAADRQSTKRSASAAAAASSSITFGGRHGALLGCLGRGYEPDTEAIAQVKEMIYRAAAMRPVSTTLAVDQSSSPSSPPQKPRRKNVRISSDPQTVAARLRREKVSERLRVLQRLVPGGSKMDTATMLDEAASYLKFLKSQLQALETLGNNGSNGSGNLLQNYYYTGSGRNDASSAGYSPRNGTVLAFGRDGLAGYVKSNRNLQL